MGGKSPSEVDNNRLDVGAGGGTVEAAAVDDGLEYEEDTMKGESPSKINNKFGLDVGAGGGAVVPTTASPGLATEFIPS